MHCWNCDYPLPCACWSPRVDYTPLFAAVAVAAVVALVRNPSAFISALNALASSAAPASVVDPSDVR